jgi:hypothetical protein
MQILRVLNVFISNPSIQQRKFKNLRVNHAFDSSYCVIDVKDDILRFSLFIARNNHMLCQVNFYANSSTLLFYLINQHSMIFEYISFEHALYVGREIYKAELSKILCQKYIQSWEGFLCYDKLLLNLLACVCIYWK